jgi:hypothetical protein
MSSVRKGTNQIPPLEQQPLMDEGLLFVETSRKHCDTSHIVGLLWMSDKPDAETSTFIAEVEDRGKQVLPKHREPLSCIDYMISLNVTQILS